MWVLIRSTLKNASYQGLCGMSFFFLKPIYTDLTLLPHFFGPVYSNSSVSGSFLLFLCFIEIPTINANSVDPDQLQHSVACGI